MPRSSGRGWKIIGVSLSSGTSFSGTKALLSGNWSKPSAAFDYNTYWHVGGGEIRFGNRTWEQWQKAGEDVHSKIADPHFVNPAGGDFQLTAESESALAGFKSFDLSTVGPRSAFRQVDAKALPNLFVWTDTCNVYVLRDGEAAILIDLGDGSVLDKLPEIGVKRIEWVLFTHHHREQCQGAWRLEGGQG